MNFAAILRGDKFTPPIGKMRLIIDGSMDRKAGVGKGTSPSTHGENQRDLILNWISLYGYVEIQDMVDELNVGPNAVIRHMRILEERGVIRCIKPAHTGHGMRNRWVKVEVMK